MSAAPAAVGASSKRVDPARATLDTAYEDARRRLDAAVQKTLRLVCGECRWHDERVRVARAEIERAAMDLQVIRNVIVALDALDVATGAL